ncbi:TPA: hypothetical protein ACGZ99_001735 [Elizabethkingia anophelis]|nr:hypothetical protein [Elizabethkingia anophelis]
MLNKLTFLFSLYLITYSCKEKQPITNQKEYFVLSQYLKEQDSLHNVKLKRAEDNKEIPPPLKRDTTAVGSLNFLIKNNDSAYFYKKSLDVNFYMCGNGIEEEREFRKPILEEDLFIKISTVEITSIINLYKVPFSKYSKRRNNIPLVVFALMRDSINNDMMKNFTSILEANGMKSYRFRKVSNYEKKAVSLWNSLTFQQQKQLNIQRHNRLYQSN